MQRTGDAGVVPEIDEHRNRPSNRRKLNGAEFSYTRRSPGRELCLSRPSWARMFKFLPHQHGTVLHQFLIFPGEGGGEVAVNIELSDHLAANKDGNDDLR